MMIRPSRGDEWRTRRTTRVKDPASWRDFSAATIFFLASSMPVVFSVSSFSFWLFLSATFLFRLCCRSAGVSFLRFVVPAASTNIRSEMRPDTYIHGVRQIHWVGVKEGGSTCLLPLLVGVIFHVSKYGTDAKQGNLTSWSTPWMQWACLHGVSTPIFVAINALDRGECLQLRRKKRQLDGYRCSVALYPTPRTRAILKKKKSSAFQTALDYTGARRGENLAGGGRRGIKSGSSGPWRSFWDATVEYHNKRISSTLRSGR